MGKQYQELLLILDLHALIHRVYHALPRLSDPQGRPIQAVYGLATMLLKIIAEIKPTHMVACLDRPEPTFRHELFKDYKTQRPPTPTDLEIQFPIAKELLAAFGVTTLELQGYEADDLIGALSHRFKAAIDILIVTGDLDTLQLVSDRVKVLTMKKGISETVTYGPKEVQQRYGFPPGAIPDFKALVGDASDNIPGIPGVGEKTATELIKKYQTVERIIEAAERGEVNPKLAAKILERKEQLSFCKQLAEIRMDLPLAGALEEFKFTPPQKEAVRPLFASLGFRKLMERLEAQPVVVQSHGIETEEGAEDDRHLETLLQSHHLISLLRSDSSYIIATEKRASKVPLENISLITSVLTNSEEIISYDVKLIFKDLLAQGADPSVTSPQQLLDAKIAAWLVNSDWGDYSPHRLTRFFLKKELPTASWEKPFAQLLLPLSKTLREELREGGFQRVFTDIEMPLIPVLCRMEHTGIMVDKEAIANFEETLKRQLSVLQAHVVSLAGETFNPNSPVALRQLLFGKLKISPKGLKKTPKGEISTQEAELLKIRNRHPVIDKLLAYRELQKLASTYAQGLRRHINPQTGRIHPLFNQTGTSTGRLSCENPNLQNIPTDSESAQALRRCFVAAPGFEFVALDYSQIELRLVAHVADDELMRLAFQQGIDIHEWAAKLLFGSAAPEFRRRAKTFNFGLMYGMGASGLAQRLGISQSEAREFIDRYFARFPGIQKLIGDLQEKAKRVGFAETPFGRKRFLPEITGLAYRDVAKAERIAVNMPIQGFAADIIKVAMLRVDAVVQEQGWRQDARLLLQIHDELIFEVRKDIIKKFLATAAPMMENAVALSVPLRVIQKVGPTLAQLKEVAP